MAVANTLAYYHSATITAVKTLYDNHLQSKRKLK